MKMTRLNNPPYSAVFYLAAFHLLLFSICPVSSRIYETNDAVVIEVDGTRANNLATRTWTLSTRNQFGNPPAIPIPYALNPYSSALYRQQQQNFPFWSSYPALFYNPARRSSVSDGPATSPETKQQNIACGVGPDTPPLGRNFPVIEFVGGHEAVPNSWPFVVGLRKSSGNVFCGGTLISSTRILTAAHCVDKLSAYEISTMTVSLGMHTQGNLPQTFNDLQQTRNVSRAVYHKDFNAKTKFNDVAVLTIDPAISYSTAISPVCLPPFNNTGDQFVGKDAAIMGWGTLSVDGTQPNALQEATVKIISNADCNAQYGSDTGRRQQLCASADGMDACKSDDGGPLVVQTKADSTSWTQVGIRSFDYGCADPNYAGVYANVAFFRKWINTYMNS